MFLTTVTQKRQVTIPKFIDFLKAYDRVKVSKKGNIVLIEPVETILDLVEKFVPRKNAHISALETRELMEKQYSRV